MLLLIHIYFLAQDFLSSYYLYRRSRADFVFRFSIKLLQILEVNLLSLPLITCCIDVKNVFCKSKMAAIKNLTDIIEFLKKDITCKLLSVLKATISED